MGLDESDEVTELGLSHGNAGIGAPIIEANRFTHQDSRAWKDHIWDITDALVGLGGSQEVILSAGTHSPGPLQVEQGPADVVEVAVAARPDPVVNQQPSLLGLNRHRARTHLG